MSQYTEWLKKFLISHADIESPKDNRPVYAYRCSDEDYTQMCSLIKTGIGSEINGVMTHGFPRLFFLYAAECFCREHQGGVWKWETILTPLELSKSPSHPQISAWIQEGSRWWGAKIVDCSRKYLVSVVCAGGLPLNLIRNESGSLYDFFREILEDCHRYNHTSTDLIESSAERLCHRLPVSLHQDIVYKIAAQIIAQVIEFQNIIGESEDPISELTLRKPDWRSMLPIRLSDDVTESFLAGLVKRSNELSHKSIGKIRWRGFLSKKNDGKWLLEKVLETPEIFTPQVVKQWLPVTEDLNEAPAQLRIILQSGDQTDVVALLSLRMRKEGKLSYRREWVFKNGLRLGLKKLVSPHLISINGELLAPQNGQPWEESLPWIFTCFETNRWEWLTEGSAKIKGDSAIVLVPSTFKPYGSDGCAEKIGYLESLEREIYEVIGTIFFKSSEGDDYRISCEESEESSESFLIHGNTLNSILLNKNSVYIGLPKLLIETAHGPRKEANGRMQWRAVYGQGNWNDVNYGKKPVGRIWLRLLESDYNVERFRCLLNILPVDFYINKKIGTVHTRGFYSISGVEKICMDSTFGSEVSIEQKEKGGLVNIYCNTENKNIDPMPLDLSLYWNDTASFEITLPYPKRGAIFQFEGEIRSNGSIFPLSRLSAIWLLLQDGVENRRFTLDIQLLGTQLAFFHELPRLKSGQLRYSLDLLHDSVDSLLASTDELDAQVAIKVMCNSEQLANITIQHFDANLVISKKENLITIDEQTCLHLGSAGVDRVNFQMISFTNPSADPINLERFSSAHPSWVIPDSLTNEPWWIIGRDGSWTRFRPRLWANKNTIVDREITFIEEREEILADIVCIKNFETRNRLMKEQIERISIDPGHPDWRLVFDYLKLTQDFPPSSIDVIKELCNNPSALIMALLKSREENFDQLWFLSEKMPFSWALFSIKDWYKSTSIYLHYLREVFSKIPTGEKYVIKDFYTCQNRIVSYRNSFITLFEWLSRCFFEKSNLRDKRSYLDIAAVNNGEYLENLLWEGGDNKTSIEGELQARHGADERWPQSPEVLKQVYRLPEKLQFRQQSSVYRPVRCAPFVAAGLCLRDISPTPQLVYELRLIRAFDPIWFFEAYSITLALGLANLSSDNFYE